MANQVPSSNELIVYRGCDTLEDHAMDGLSAASFNFHIANIFNYGTILKIHILPQSRFIVCSEFVNDSEEQVILAPCDYEILSERMEMFQGKNTRIVEIVVHFRDILTDFLIAMQQQTEDYMEECGITQDYLDAFSFLYQIMIRRTLHTDSERLVEAAVENQEVPTYPENKKRSLPYSDILLLKFLLQAKNMNPSSIVKEIHQTFYFVSPEEQ